MNNGKDNYETARQNAQRLFLQYDVEEIIKRFSLRSDEEWIYLRFLGKNCQICKKTGQIFMEGPDGTRKSAGFSEALTIYDVLCTAKENAVLSGNYCPVNSLPSVTTANQPKTDGFHNAAALHFDHRTRALQEACIRLGGCEETEVPVKGDLVMRLYLFDFLPVILQFYESDEEFPASLQIMWDKNTLDFMKYETVWYAAGYIHAELMAADK